MYDERKKMMMNDGLKINFCYKSLFQDKNTHVYMMKF